MVSLYKEAIRSKGHPAIYDVRRELKEARKDYSKAKALAGIRHYNQEEKKWIEGDPSSNAEIAAHTRVVTDSLVPLLS